MNKRGLVKLALKVSFKNENLTEFKIIRINEFYAKSNINHISRYFFAESGFMIGEEEKFLISSYELTLPKKFDKNKNTPMCIYSVTDKDRHRVLKRIQTALLEWSNSIHWSNSTEFSDTPRIMYHNKLWLLY